MYNTQVASVAPATSNGLRILDSMKESMLKMSTMGATSWDKESWASDNWRDSHRN